MTPDDKDALRPAGAGLDADLRVVVKGRVVCCVGLLTTVYFLDGDTAEVRERVCQALDLYLKTIGNSLRWGSDRATKRPRAIAGTNILSPRQWLGGVNPVDGMSLTAHGGQKIKDAAPHFVQFFARKLTPGQLSYFTFGLPFEWIATHEAAAFPTLVVQLCEILKPIHGYAGLAVIPFVNLDRSEAAFGAVTALAARFRGLEVDIPWSHAIYLAKEDRIKGINWLSIIDRERIERLGGSEALTAALGAGILRYPFSTGVVIQAGPRPLLGDVHLQEPMPHYTQVARALKPIRIDSILSLSSPHGFDRDRTDKWLARFD